MFSEKQTCKKTEANIKFKMKFYSYTETLEPDIVGLQLRAGGVGICSTLL
jgi:hypothetical protein